MPEADRCSLNIPFPSWARDNPNTPELDYQNWLEVMRWADRYHREQCGGGGGGVGRTIDFGEGVVMTGYSRITYPMVDGELEAVVGVLSSAGTTDTDAEIILWDGVLATTIASITIPANEIYVRVDVGVDFVTTDGWQMRVITAGTGAGGASFDGLWV